MLIKLFVPQQQSQAKHINQTKADIQSCNLAADIRTSRRPSRYLCSPAALKWLFPKELAAHGPFLVER